MKYKARGFILGRSFRPSLMFFVRSIAYPRVEHLKETCFTWVGSGHTRKHYTGLECPTKLNAIAYNKQGFIALDRSVLLLFFISLALIY